MDHLLGTYYCDGTKDEGFDAFFESQGLPTHVREMMRKPTTKTIRKNEDGSYSMELSMDGRVMKTFKFKLGEPFEHTNPMGKVNHIITMDGETMVDDGDFGGSKVITRTGFEDGLLVVRMTTSDGIVATRYFTKTG